MTTVAQLAGQRLMIGFEGTGLSAELRRLVRRLRIGGVILFRRNLECPAQIRALCAEIQDFARAVGLPPLFIAVDQEGGRVARLPEPFTRFDGNPKMACVADARRFAAITARELFHAGFNMNMAPVLDVSPADIDSVMADRAFGSDPAWVARLGSEVIAGLQQKRIMAVAKHFPGIGRTVADSHLDLPTLDTDLAGLEAFDLVPFREAVASGVDGMMLSHIRYRGLDEKWPASLSVRVTRDLLRGQLGFGGAVLTDDLDMGAIANHFDIETAAEQVLRAEVDIALICHSREKMEKAFERMSAVMAASDKLRAAAHTSCRRLLQLKAKYTRPAGHGQ